MILKKIKILRKKFKQYNIDGYIIPKNDEYFSEYAKNDRLKNITGFSGSAGFAVVLKKQNYLFVDGRYTIQAHQQSSKNFKIIEIHKKLPHTIIKNFNLGYDPTLFTSKLLNRYFKNNNLISIDQNLIDQIFKFKEKPTKPFYSLDTKIVGEPYSSKISKVVRFLKNNKADYCFISAPENVAWLLNIRGYDNPNSPIANARLILNKKKEFFLIANEKKLKNLLLDKKIKKKQILPIKSLPQFLDNLKGKNFIIDNKTCSIFYEKIIKSNFNILKFDDPVYELKSIKNSNEIKHMIEAHKKDGLALTRFIYWIKNVNKKKITEVYAQNKLEKFRKLNKDYLFPSFDTIAGAGSNGAIVHYRANKKTTKKIEQNDILLVDSGGQYHYGTTDVTRTISFSKKK